MRRAAKVDDNQREIVRAFRQLGCSVQTIHMIGAGVPDILVGTHGRNYLVEIKDGRKPPSARQLTDDERDWHNQWRGQVAIVENIDDVLRLFYRWTDCGASV